MGRGVVCTCGAEEGLSEFVGYEGVRQKKKE